MHMIDKGAIPAGLFLGDSFVVTPNGPKCLNKFPPQSDGAGVRSVLKLMVELGINPKASQIKTEEVVDLALCKRLGGDGGS